MSADWLSGNLSRRTFLRTGAGYLVLQSSVTRGWTLPADTTAPLECLAGGHQAYPPLLEKFIGKLDPAADDFPCEVYVVEIEKTLAAWRAAWCLSISDHAALRNSVSRDVAGSLYVAHTDPLRTTGPLRCERRLFANSESHGVEALLHQWAIYLMPLVSLTMVELQIYRIHVITESPLRLETEMRCDLVGANSEGEREQRVGSWTMRWNKQPDGQWLVERWQANPEIRSRLKGPGFTEMTAGCLGGSGAGLEQLSPGIDHWRTVLDGAGGIDVYGNHGIAVGDIDNSGYDSFYVCQPSGLPNRLYRNRGDGTFEDVTALSGTGILDGTASALFVDFLNRGRQDLLVVRSGGPLLFLNLGNGRFEAKPDAFRFAQPPQGTFTSAAVADYNRDGLLDIYFCVYSYYKGLDQYQFPSPYYDAQNGPPNFLFRNRGDGTFEDVTAASGLNAKNNRFSFAAAWCDYDHNGWPDIYVANDFGRKNLYRNQGDGTFIDVADALAVEDYGPGMSTCWLDYDNDGRQDVYVANMWLNEGQRITASDRFLPGVDPAIRAIYQKHNAGNSLYRNQSGKQGPGAFEDKTRQAGAQMGRWSWSCAAWDFDHDGASDLYVANGFVSGPNHHDLLSFFWRQVAQHSAQPKGMSGEYEMAWNAINELVRSDYSWSGYERNVFFANNGNGTFSDVSGVLGLDLRDDSRAYGLSDFDHDGRLEFVLKNRTGPQVRILRNDMEGIGGSVAFRLIGHTSNRDAIGATITIVCEGKTQTKFLSAGSGFASQHTKEVFFGVGAAAQPLAVTITWPHGAVSEYHGIPINHRIEIEEGAPSFKAAAYSADGAHRGRKQGALAAPAPPATLSTWLVERLFGPDIALTDQRGNRRQLRDAKGSPVLLCLLRLDCGASREQLQLLKAGAATLRDAGLEVIAAMVSPNAGEDPLRPMALASAFPLYLADEQSIRAWGIQYRYLFDRRRDMIPPLSFLLDAEGAVVRIYQGVVQAALVIADWQFIRGKTDQNFARTVPFPGPYFGNPLQRDYFTYGIAFVEYNFIDEAQAAFERATQQQPDYAAAWFNLGTIYLNKKMYPQAVKSLNQAVRLNPNDADAWNNLGMIAGQQENYDEALKDFLAAARANPNNALAVDNMMRVYRFQGRAADAQKSLQELLAKAPENADLHLALGMALVAQHDLSRAREELETAVRLRPNSSDAMNDLGAVLLQMGQTQEALAWFAKCRSLAPDFDRPFINSAMIYNSSGQPAMGRKVLEEFLARHPDNADVRATLEKMAAP